MKVMMIILNWYIRQIRMQPIQCGMEKNAENIPVFQNW